MKPIKTGIVGATGAVGKVALQIFDELNCKSTSKNFELNLFASPRSHGTRLGELTVQKLDKNSFKGLDLIFFDASDSVSKEWVPVAIDCGARVIDNSAVYRLNADVPLIVPEINAHLLTHQNRLISGPNCTTVQLVMALWPLHKTFGLKRVVVSTYQSVSGAGTLAVQELKSQISDPSQTPKALSQPIAFNLIPQIGKACLDSAWQGYTSEEQKIILETKKILNLPELAITATAVRVPTLSCHAESVCVELNTSFEIQDILSCLAKMPGVKLLDDLEQGIFPTNLKCQDKDEVFIGRIRKDFSCANSLQMWVVSDNLRKGAALNGIQIAQAWSKVWTN